MENQINNLQSKVNNTKNHFDSIVERYLPIMFYELTDNSFRSQDIKLNIPNYEAIRKATTDHGSSMFIDKLVAKFDSNPDDMSFEEYQYLYYGWIYTEKYMAMPGLNDRFTSDSGRIINVILSSGDGSEQKPFHTASVADEYNILYDLLLFERPIEQRYNGETDIFTSNDFPPVHFYVKEFVRQTDHWLKFQK